MGHRNMDKIEIRIVKTEKESAEAEEIKRQVFQNEQGIAAELVFDGKDAEADHFVAYSENKPIGTTRVRYIDDGAIAKIERMAVLKEFRRQNIGRKMIEYIIIYLRKKGVKKAILNAQEYVIGFYEKLGFKKDGDVFEEAEIPHIKMQKML